MENKLFDKIRKLLALAGNNPNENEAAQALSLAQKLMIEHGISEEALKPEQIRMIIGDPMSAAGDAWSQYAGAAAAALYGCKLIRHWDGTVSFAGREENVGTAQLTFLFISNQIENLYKQALPKGLTQSERGEFRKSFKRGAAIRVLERANEIIQNSKTHGTDGKNALVVVSHLQTLSEEVDQFLSGKVRKGKPGRGITVRDGDGYRRGRMAGDTVRMNQAVR